MASARTEIAEGRTAPAWQGLAACLGLLAALVLARRVPSVWWLVPWTLVLWPMVMTTSRHRPLTDLGWCPPRNGRHDLYEALLAGFGGLILLEALVRHGGTDHWPAPTGASPTGPIGWALWAAGQAVCVALPEELFFRGYLQGQGHRRWPNAPLGVMLAVSVLFGLFHVVTWGRWMAVSTTLPALVFAWLYWRSGSLLGPTAVHVLYNLGYALTWTSLQSASPPAL